MLYAQKPGKHRLRAMQNVLLKSINFYIDRFVIVVYVVVMKNTIRVDDYSSLRLIMWNMPGVDEISMKDAHEHYSSKWEYVFLRSLNGREIMLINELIDEFGPILPRYRTFQTYGAERPYTHGCPITHLSRLTTSTSIKVANYPQFQKSALLHNFIAGEVTRNEAFLWYTEYWSDIDLNTINKNERDFINELIFEFGPILPSIVPKSKNVGAPIINV